MRRLTAIFGILVLLAACTTKAVPSVPAMGTQTAATSASPIPSPCADCVAVTRPSDAPTRTASVDPSPSADAWVSAGAFNDFRVVTQLALLGTGEVLAVGADNVCGVESAGSDTIEIGDPRAGTWSMAASLPSPRNMPVLVALADGRALVAGGATGEYVAKSGTVVFDPVTRTWSSSGLLNTARIYPAVAALPDGRVLAAGGLLISGSQEQTDLDTAEIWDPKTGRWSRTSDLSVTRVGPAAITLVDGRVLVVGGFPSNGADEERPTAELYDPATRDWTPAGTLTTPPSGLSVVALPDGGALAVRRDAGGVLAAERFDAVSGTWTLTTDVGIRTAPGRATTVAMKDGRVLVLAGTYATVYDPTSATWTPTTAIPDGRNDASAVLLDDGSVLVGAGWSERPLNDTPGCPTAIAELWRFVPGTR